MVNGSILLVDDDINVLETTEFLLLDEGYQVITAKNGKEAIDVFIKNKPILTFMDIKMPVLNGIDAFFKIIKHNPEAKIILTSSYAVSNEDMKKAKKLSLTSLLSKPYEINSMINLIQKYSN